jgi:hypothetical protein
MLLGRYFRKLSATGHYEPQAGKTIVFYGMHGFRNGSNTKIILMLASSNGVNTPYRTFTLLAYLAIATSVQSRLLQFWLEEDRVRFKTCLMKPI